MVHYRETAQVPAGAHSRTTVMTTAPAATPEKRLRNGHLNDSNSLNRHTFKAFAHIYLEQLAEMGNLSAHAALAPKFQAVLYYSTRQALSPLPAATSTDFTTKGFMCHPDLEPGLTCLAFHTFLFTLILVCDVHIPETCPSGPELRFGCLLLSFTFVQVSLDPLVLELSNKSGIISRKF